MIWLWMSLLLFGQTTPAKAIEGSPRDKEIMQQTDSDLPLNKKAEEWEVEDWLNSKPLKLGDLKGKVILVRWWTGPHCPFCNSSAPALNEFHDQYAKKGLQVIGFYHHKSRKPLDKKAVASMAERMGFRFPVAIDYEWKTLQEWWLKDHKRSWTSVSFLIDRKGMIRFIHPGGSYIKGDADYNRLRSQIELLLEEKLVETK